MATAMIETSSALRDGIGRALADVGFRVLFPESPGEPVDCYVHQTGDAISGMRARFDAMTTAPLRDGGVYILVTGSGTDDHDLRVTSLDPGTMRAPAVVIGWEAVAAEIARQAVVHGAGGDAVIDLVNRTEPSSAASRSGPGDPVSQPAPGAR
ncbi:MAG: hypothetical protein QOG64_2846 [Acidimicrobiaceae bacterium]|nr:hypothetical protein [Acidimicrobiaceae bacterium]